jgi:DNA-binding Lrp family transcriptional regulator
MDYARSEDPAFRTPYSLCGFCRCQINSREEARWVNIGTEWKQISCTECASGYDPMLVTPITEPYQLNHIRQYDEEMDSISSRMIKLQQCKISAIMQILEEEGVKNGITMYFRYRPYVVTGTRTDTYGSRCEMYVEMTPAKKDGSASKINKTELKWIDAIRMWRMQRADVDGYMELMKQHEEEIKKRRTMKITDDML